VVGEQSKSQIKLSDYPLIKVRFKHPVSNIIGYSQVGYFTSKPVEP